jgi:hypothetical protein
MKHFLSSLVVVLASLITASLAAADSSVLVGKWRGSYSCLQGHTGLQLTFGEGDGAAIAGEFAFFALEDNPDVPTGRFAVSATYNEESRSVAVKGVRWIKQPTNYRMVDLTGTLSEDGKHIDGKVEFKGCTSFHVTREGGARTTKAKGG